MRLKIWNDQYWFFQFSDKFVICSGTKFSLFFLIPMEKKPSDSDRGRWFHEEKENQSIITRRIELVFFLLFFFFLAADNDSEERKFIEIFLTFLNELFNFSYVQRWR